MQTSTTVIRNHTQIIKFMKKHKCKIASVLLKHNYGSRNSHAFEIKDKHQCAWVL